MNLVVNLWPNVADFLKIIRISGTISIEVGDKSFTDSTDKVFTERKASLQVHCWYSKTHPNSISPLRPVIAVCLSILMFSLFEEYLWQTQYLTLALF